jgi:hypothetical protein
MSVRCIRVLLVCGGDSGGDGGKAHTYIISRWTVICIETHAYMLALPLQRHASHSCRRCCTTALPSPTTKASAGWTPTSHWTQQCRPRWARLTRGHQSSSLQQHWSCLSWSRWRKHVVDGRAAFGVLYPRAVLCRAHVLLLFVSESVFSKMHEWLCAHTLSRAQHCHVDPSLLTPPLSFPVPAVSTQQCSQFKSDTRGVG